MQFCPALPKLTVNILDRAQALRNANPPRGRQQEFTRQRDRAGYGKQGTQPASGADGGQTQPRRSQGSEDRNSPSNASKKRTDELRTWSNDFNNAYQPPSSAPANVASAPPASDSADAPNGSPTQNSQVVLDSSQADTPTTPNATTQESNNATATSPVPSEPQTSKKFQFNPDAKPFVPNVPKMPPTSTVPLVQSYVLTPMPPVSTMVPPFLPHSVVNSSQMNQSMQAAPPLIAQPGGLVMRYDMPRMFLSF